VGDNEIFVNDDTEAEASTDYASASFSIPIKAGTVISGISKTTSASV
jgi:hypothetical protein